jgi:hypothetical protein
VRDALGVPLGAFPERAQSHAPQGIPGITAPCTFLGVRLLRTEVPRQRGLRRPASGRTQSSTAYDTTTRDDPNCYGRGSEPLALARTRSIVCAYRATGANVRPDSDHEFLGKIGDGKAMLMRRTDRNRTYLKHIAGHILDTYWTSVAR